MSTQEILARWELIRSAMEKGETASEAIERLGLAE